MEVKIKKTKAVRRNGRSRQPLTEPMIPVNMEEVRSRFMEIWSDPMDTRNEREIAEELGVTIETLKSLRLDPRFYEAATFKFQQSFKSNLIPIFKNLVNQAVKYRSIGASKILLEILGLLEGRGTKVQVNNYQGRNIDTSSLTNEELESEIHRLEIELFPSDLRIKNCKVLPRLIEDTHEVS